MGRVFTLAILFLLALGSFAGFLYLTEVVSAGNLKIAAGQKQLEEGEQMLANGKARLANGEQRLSQGKEVRNVLRSVPLFGSALPTGVVAATEVGAKITSSKVSEGEQLVAKGKQKIKAGEAQLAAGKLELARGKNRLREANVIRIACGIAAIIFAGLFILLGISWKKRPR